VTVKNTGKRSGATIVQLYLQDVTASISRPVKQLKNFEKVELQPGEEKVVTFTINEPDLRYYNEQLKWASDPGKFNVFIGLDSQNVKQTSFLLK
jgi:beta-glucosidase